MRVEDGQGGKAEASFSVTIKGTNDQPEVTLDADSELGLIESGVGRTDDGQVVTAPGTEEENQPTTVRTPMTRALSSWKAR